MENEELNKKEEIQNEESQDQMQSRRDFFKEAGRRVLPMIGVAILSGLPLSSTYGACHDCSATCGKSCFTVCSSGCGYSSKY